MRLSLILVAIALIAASSHSANAIKLAKPYPQDCQWRLWFPFPC